MYIYVAYMQYAKPMTPGSPPSLDYHISMKTTLEGKPAVKLYTGTTTIGSINKYQLYAQYVQYLYQGVNPLGYSRYPCWACKLLPMQHPACYARVASYIR